MGRSAYNWESDNAVREEVVIQAGKICAASCEKLDGGVDLYRESISTLNHIEDLLLLLLELAALASKVLADIGGAIEGDESRNVV